MLQKLLTHLNHAMTQRYVHFTDEAMHRAQKFWIQCLKHQKNMETAIVKNEIISWEDALRFYKITYDQLIAACKDGLQVYNSDGENVLIQSRELSEDIPVPMVTWGRINFDSDADELIVKTEVIDTPRFFFKIFPQSGDFILLRKDGVLQEYEQKAFICLMNVDFNSILSPHFFKLLLCAIDERYVFDQNLALKSSCPQITNNLFANWSQFFKQSIRGEKTSLPYTLEWKPNFQEIFKEENSLIVDYKLKNKYTKSVFKSTLSFQIENSHFYSNKKILLERKSATTLNIRFNHDDFISKQMSCLEDLDHYQEFLLGLQSKAAEIAIQNASLLCMINDNNYIPIPGIQELCSAFKNFDFTQEYNSQYVKDFYETYFNAGINTYLPKEQPLSPKQKILDLNFETSPIIKGSSDYQQSAVEQACKCYFVYPQDIHGRGFELSTKGKIIDFLDTLISKTKNENDRQSLTVARLKFAKEVTHVEAFDILQNRFGWKSYNERGAKDRSINEHLKHAKKLCCQGIPEFPNWKEYGKDSSIYLKRIEEISKTETGWWQTKEVSHSPYLLGGAVVGFAAGAGFFLKTPHVPDTPKIRKTSLIIYLKTKFNSFWQH